MRGNGIVSLQPARGVAGANVKRVRISPTPRTLTTLRFFFSKEEQSMKAKLFKNK